MARYYEDFAVGQTFETGEYELGLDEIIEFARKYDPQTFHTDPEGAKATRMGELIASGWQTTAVTMRLIVDSKVFDETLGVGVDELRWMRPVRPGDRLRVTGEIESMRPSATKPVGIVRVKMVAKNQHNEDVMSMTSIIQPRRKS